MANIKKIQVPGESTARSLVDTGAIRYDSSTSLTNEQQIQARTNIGAVDSTYVQEQIADIGRAMKFIGRATINITDGATTSASDLGIEGYTARRKGDVILNKDDQREFVWDGSVWEELGKEGDYVIKEAGKGLSTNDLTTDLKSKYDAAYTHSTSDHLQLGTTSTTAAAGDHTHTDYVLKGSTSNVLATATIS